MIADGAYRWQGNWPAPDTTRVAEIDAAWDDAQAATFADPARAGAVEQIGGALAAMQGADLADASSLLVRARSTLDGLDPGALEPRGGLAGLFDGRGARLKRFRGTWSRAAAELTDIATELSVRIDRAVRRSATLDGVWVATRDSLADLDAHLGAASARLTGHQAAADAPPHPLLARKATLDTCRAAAMQVLPLIRSAQNTEARAAEALKAWADGATVWRDDWKTALGLSGKRPRSVRPDPIRMTSSRDHLKGCIDRAEAELKLTQTRRADVEARLENLRARL